MSSIKFETGATLNQCCFSRQTLRNSEASDSDWLQLRAIHVFNQLKPGEVLPVRDVELQKTFFYVKELNATNSVIEKPLDAPLDDLIRLLSTGHKVVACQQLLNECIERHLVDAETSKQQVLEFISREPISQNPPDTVQ